VKLFAALAAAQAEFPGVAKDAKNPHLGNRYASLASTIEAVRPILARHGLAFLQPLETASDDAHARVRTILLHSSGEHIEHVADIPIAPMKGALNAQAYGSAVSYLRRYALQSMLGLSTCDDDDGTAASPPVVRPAAPPEDRMRRMLAAFEAIGVMPGELDLAFGDDARSLERMTEVYKRAKAQHTANGSVSLEDCR
jgi:hypothetical protein